MSRIGKLSINIPSGVEVNIEGSYVRVKGPKGTLERNCSPEIEVLREGDDILIKRPSDIPLHRSLQGLNRTLVNNMVKGVSEGFSKTLEIVGVGYRAALKNGKLEILAGFSHPVVFDKMPGIDFEVPIPTKIIVHGADKQQVGEVAAEIRAVRKPEPYKGKGIKYEGEYIRRKVGKTAK